MFRLPSSYFPSNQEVLQDMITTDSYKFWLFFWDASRKRKGKLSKALPTSNFLLVLKTKATFYILENVYSHSNSFKEHGNNDCLCP